MCAEGRVLKVKVSKTGRHAVESKGDCAALAVVLITVHRQDWSALLDNHYCC